MKAVVIGATGHTGTYLVPRLVDYGFEVIAVTRGLSEPYTPAGEWREVKRIQLDRTEEEKAGTFGKKIAEMNPDIVVDLISYSVESTKSTVQALKGTNLSHYLFASSIWEHGAAAVTPADEDTPRHPIDDYGRDKVASVTFLHDEFVKNGFPYTAVMPGHITGPGWTCINPTGNFDPEIFGKIGRGETIYIPHFGMECVHHVHADDVAQVFFRAIQRRTAALDQDFLAVAPQAMTLRGFAESMYAWFGKEPNIAYLPWEAWKKTAGSQAFINSTYSHLAHSDNYSCEKARRILGYAPRYTILQAVCECVSSMIARGVINVS